MLAGLLVLVVVAFLQAGYWYLYYSANAQSTEETEVQNQLKTHKLQLTKLSQVDDFLAVSKIQRQIIQLEKRLQGASEARTHSSYGRLLRSYSRYMPWALYAVLVAMFWTHPVANIPHKWIWPLGTLLACPGHGDDNIGILAWLLMSHVVLSRTSRSLAESLGIYTPSSGWSVSSYLKSFLAR